MNTNSKATPEIRDLLIAEIDEMMPEFGINIWTHAQIWTLLDPSRLIEYIFPSHAIMDEFGYFTGFSQLEISVIVEIHTALKEGRFVPLSEDTLEAAKEKTQYAKDERNKKKSIAHLDLTNGTFSTENSLSKCYWEKGELLFLTGQFKNGYYIGFWSKNPCGTVTDQDQGWAVVNPKTLKPVMCKITKSNGNTKKGYAEWRAKVKARYGTAKRLLNEYDEAFWTKGKDC